MSRIDRKALRQAMRARDLGRLEGVLDAVKDGELEVEMDEEVEEARRLLDKLVHLHHITTSLQELKDTGNIRMLMEQLPPHPIQLTVLRAVLFALGVAEERLQDWTSIQRTVGSSDEDLEAFVDTVVNVNRGSLTASDVSRAQGLLARCHLNEIRVHSVCPPLTPFYLWLTTLTGEMSSTERQDSSED